MAGSGGTVPAGGPAATEVSHDAARAGRHKMSWGKGQDVVEDLLTEEHLEQVPANPDEAQYLLGRARAHLGTAAREVEADPEIAYDALYAAARKALTAVLRQQGLRPTRAGGHEAVIQATEAQLVPPLGAVVRPYPLRLPSSRPRRRSSRRCLCTSGGAEVRRCVREDPQLWKRRSPTHLRLQREGSDPNRTSGGRPRHRGRLHRRFHPGAADGMTPRTLVRQPDGFARGSGVEQLVDSLERDSHRFADARPPRNYGRGGAQYQQADGLPAERMVAMSAYTATATREGRWWVIDVAGVGVTQSRRSGSCQ